MHGHADRLCSLLTLIRLARARLRRLLERNLAAYRNRPEEVDDVWVDAQAWGAE